MANPEKINNETTQKVAVVGLNKIPFDYYLYNKTVDITLTAPTAINDAIINVVATTGCVIGDVITFYEGSWMFQNIVKSFTTTAITLAAPIDYAFTTDAIIDVGKWNMAVDGSSTTQIFSIKSPPDCMANIHTLSVSMLNSSAMDDGLFGGITQLTNGMIWRFVDGVIKHLAVIVNNLGFKEIGFKVEYSSKAPAGQYGLIAVRDINKVNGTIICLKNDSELQVHIQDDLRALNLVAVIANGHLA